LAFRTNVFDQSKIIFLSLNQVQRNALILRITLEPQDKLNSPQSLSKAEVDSVNHGREIKGSLSPLGPSPRGPEKFVAADLPDQQFF
jgi:hypothetical protein